MSTHTQIPAACALLITASLAYADHGHDRRGGPQACFRTTDAMAEACRADAIDDYWTDIGRCRNTDDFRECRREARDALRETRHECRVAEQGRDDLCRRLPDAGPYITDLDPADFDGTNGVCGTVDGQNPWLPLIPGTVKTFVSDVEDEEETIIVTVTHETREIEGIDAIVVRDTVYEGLPDENDLPQGDRIEDTDDYYAIDADCNVWYLGEIAQNFEDGYLTDLDGSFIAGEDDAQAGIVMLADPRVGDVYRQEFALGEAEDAAEVLDLDADLIEDGELHLLDVDGEPVQCDGMCLKTEDFIANEPDAVEHKYYVRGVGFVAEQLPDGEIVLELVKIERP